MPGRLSRFSKAFQSGIRDALAPYDQPGEDITVNPFKPGEVTTGAGLVRALTALAAARRSRANWRVEQQDKAASRYRQALEVQALEKRLGAPDYDQLRLDESGRHNREMEGIARDREARLGKPRPASPGDRSANASFYRLVLDQMDKDAGRFADEQMSTPRIGPGGRKLVSVADTGQRLAARLAEAATPSEQMKYARALGVSPQSQNVVDAEGNITSQPVFDAKRPGLYSFDPKDVSTALQSWSARRRSGFVDQWNEQNASKRSAYSRALEMSAFPGVSTGEEDDPLMQAAQDAFGGP